MTEVVTAATTQVVAASTPKPTAKPKVLKIVPAAPTVSTRKKKGVIIRDPEEELHDDTPAETLSVKYKGKGILVKDSKPMKKKDQIEMDAEYARKLQEEEESHVQAKDVQAKDVQAKGIQYIMRYDGYKKNPQSESEARKNMIAYLKNTEGFKMAFFKGKTYDQIRLIFQARFSTSKPTNFSDDYLLVTLNTMFEKIDAQDVIWRSQQTEHGQALVKSWKLLTSCGVHIITFTTIMFALLVKKKYPLSRFTLEQLVNVARLQLLELMLLKRSKENTKCVSAAGEELTAAKHKLILLELKLVRDAAAAHMK
nr:hypothetical protein [Tanacetum cinerariifolium]